MPAPVPVPVEADGVATQLETWASLRRHANLAESETAYRGRLDHPWEEQAVPDPHDLSASAVDL